MYEDLDESMRIYANSIVNDSYLRGAMSFGAKPTISITKDSSLNVGYRVRLEIKLRHNIEDVLKVIQRKLLQLEIESTVKERESSHRPRPILIIRGIDNLDKTMTFLDATWDTPIQLLS